MKKLVLSMFMVFGIQSFSQEVLIPKVKIYHAYEMGVGVGGNVHASDKLLGSISGGVEFDRKVKLGLSFGVSRFENYNYLPIQFVANHQWNFRKIFIFEEIGGGYSYSLAKPEQINYYDWYGSYMRAPFGGFNLEGVIGVGISLNDHIDIRLGVAYNYQELYETRTYGYSSLSSSEFNNYYNRFSVSTGLVFHK